MQLPPGKKPLREIEQQADASERVIDLTIVIDYALAALDPPEAPAKPLSPSDRMKRHAAWFSSIKDLMFAVGVRNDLVHAKSAAQRLPTDSEIKRAAKILRNGLLEILPRIPADLGREIIRDSHADKDRSRRAPKKAPSTSRTSATNPTIVIERDPGNRTRLFIGLAIAALAIVVLPPLLRRVLHGSEADADPARRSALAALERFESLKDSPGFTDAIEGLASDVATGNHWWSQLEFDAAKASYRAASAWVPDLEVRLKQLDAAKSERTNAEHHKSVAMRERAAEDAKKEWDAALARFEAGELELAAGKNRFGSENFKAASDGFATAESVALATRANRIATSRAAAEDAYARGETILALDSWYAAARDGDPAARERFDAVAPTTPDYWLMRAKKILEDDSIPLPDRLRASIALAERNAATPQALTARTLLDWAYHQALRIPDPRYAADFLLSIARAQVRFARDRDVAASVRATADALSVVARDPETVLRYAQLAAVSAQLDDDASRDTFLRTALETVQETGTLSSLPEAIYLADSGRLDDALARALELREGPELRDYALIALSWVAWRAAEFGNEEIHRKAVLAANETGLEGASRRGAITLLQFVRADVALARAADADAMRKRITDPPTRAAADYALAELRARRDELEIARELFVEVAHPTSPFGSPAAAEIGAAMARAPRSSAYDVLSFADSLTLGDVRGAALGGAAQEYARLTAR